MDIRQVLNNLYPGVYAGPMSGTGNTYKQFADHWPAGNGPVPTEAAMEAEWAIIQAEDAALKTDDQIMAEIDALIPGSTNAGMKSLIKAVAFELFKKDENALKRHGVNIER